MNIIFFDAKYIYKYTNNDKAESIKVHREVIAYKAQKEINFATM